MVKRERQQQDAANEQKKWDFLNNNPERFNDVMEYTKMNQQYSERMLQLGYYEEEVNETYPNASAGHLANLEKVLWGYSH